MKLSNPFGDRPYRITQTTHGHLASNPNNLNFQKAIDAVGDVAGDDPVFAQADGTIQKVVVDPKKSYQSYIQVKYDGLSFPKQYVHIIPYKNIKFGIKVLRGQRIGTLHPSVLDKKGKVIFAQHLHDAFYDASGKGKAPNPLEYLDRNTKVVASHPEILAIKWFKSGKFQWSQIADLHFKGTLLEGRYELTQATWIKQKPDTKELNYKKCSTGAVGNVLPQVVKNGGFEWQFIAFNNLSGWIPNFVLKATVKPITTHNLVTEAPVAIEEPKPVNEPKQEVPETPTPVIDQKLEEKESDLLKEDIETIKKANNLRYQRLQELYDLQEKKYKELLLDKDNEIERLKRDIEAKDLIVLSLRKKRGLMKIENVFTKQEALKFVENQSKKSIKESLPKLVSALDKLLQKVVAYLQKIS